MTHCSGGPSLIADDWTVRTNVPICPGSRSCPTKPLIIWLRAAGLNACGENIEIQLSRVASVDREKEQKNGGAPTWPGCWPGMAARTLMVVPRGPKAEGGMLGWKEGLVKTTLAWGWGPL